MSVKDETFRKWMVVIAAATLEQKFKNLNHTTLPEIRDFNGLCDA